MRNIWMHPSLHFFRYIPRWSCGGAELCNKHRVPIYPQVKHVETVFILTFIPRSFSPFWNIQLPVFLKKRRHKVWTPAFDNVDVPLCRCSQALSAWMAAVSRWPYFGSLWTCVIALKSGLQLGPLEDMLSRLCAHHHRLLARWTFCSVTWVPENI